MYTIGRAGHGTERERMVATVGAEFLPPAVYEAAHTPDAGVC